MLTTQSRTNPRAKHVRVIPPIVIARQTSKTVRPRARHHTSRFLKQCSMRRRPETSPPRCSTSFYSAIFDGRATAVPSPTAIAPLVCVHFDR